MRAPACFTRVERVGSPSNPWEAVPCCAISAACRRAAVASESSHRKAGNPCARRAWFSDANKSFSALSAAVCAGADPDTTIARTANATNRIPIFMVASPKQIVSIESLGDRYNQNLADKPAASYMGRGAFSTCRSSLKLPLILAEIPPFPTQIPIIARFAPLM